MHRGFTIRETAQIGVFSGLAVVFGYLLAPLPNVELFTAIIFLAGLLLGSYHGMLVGVIAASIFAVYNPWGPSPMPLLIAQVVSRALVGLTGGWLADLRFERRSVWLRGFCFGMAGLLLTTFYNIACAVSYVISAGFSFERLAAEIVTGFLLISIGTLSNVLIFGLVIPNALDYLKRFSVLQAK